jgi:hypothetical protein
VNEGSPEGFQKETGQSNLARHRKTIIENLGLIVTLLATGFAGWSGYEAHETRKDAHQDAMTTLKIAQRSYVEAENPAIVGRFGIVNSSEVPSIAVPLIEGLEKSLIAKYAVRVYGNSPAFQVIVLANCRVGTIGNLMNKNAGISDADIKTPPLALPSTMVAGAQFQIQAGCENPDDEKTGAVMYGAIHYKDVFGEAHYTHFCYYNPYLLVEAIGNPDPKRWNERALKAGQNLIPCETFNDSDLPVVQ